ncbi:adenylate/guanylate cyclase domain-containing protein [Micromonospora rifamycinica]|uniref:AAA ATPase domain-containing protein n=1 Tax=Micromonospora rifamycinica TaxID=291594 RepID=A0A1C5HCS8_9ACTN|nr:adenylate/guanylate cyclase domain-containing protein [Micromonospora rifamycinica]SCG43839.1 AAA ATPase domain-containing protein [Micromonospora rifamycinica]
MPLSTVGTGREDVTTSPWPVPQERRTLTVLFADIVGSTALTERLDPEDVRAVQFAYFDIVAGVLRRWQGTVEKYVGDAVMALFGARTSDGLDGYRAVRAALEIQTALDRRVLPGGVRLRVRVGVATGEAVVDLAGVRDGGHGMASGAVLTTAARIQEYAPAGGVVVCAATHRATAGLVDQHALAPATLTGKALPVDVWRVTRTGHPRPTRHHGPLIGRRREVATVRDQLTRAAREHRPRWVALVGPDGIGRSRLLAELRHRLPEVDGTPVCWTVAHCPPYPEQVLGPVAELLRDLAGLAATDPAETVHARLAALVEGLLPAHRAAVTVAALGALLAAPDRSAETGAAAVRQVLLALAARRPVVVGVDDLDRAAPQVNHFLHTLFATATARGLPLAVLATHRPEHVDPLPLPGHRRQPVELPPLDTVHTGRLLRRLVARAGRPATDVVRLVPLVAGRPGYAAAYVDAARPGTPQPPAGRSAEPALPESLRRRAAARLDRCDGPHRAVLMAAATLDGEFTASAVAGLLGWTPGRVADSLRRLTDAGLVRPGARGGHVIADPALRRCASDRLPRTVRADFARRAGTALPAAHADLARRAGTALPPGRGDLARRAGTALPAASAGRGDLAHRAAPGRPAAPAHRVGVGVGRKVPGIRSIGGSTTGIRSPWRRTVVTAPAGDAFRLRTVPPDAIPSHDPRRVRVDVDGPRRFDPLRRSGGSGDRDPRPGAGVAHAGAVIVPLPVRVAAAPAGPRPGTGGRRRRGEGVPRPAVPLPARAA